MEVENNKSTKIIAEFAKWDGNVIAQEIKREWIEDIVFAIEGQLTIANKLLGLYIKGSDYFHVDIYEVANDTN